MNGKERITRILKHQPADRIGFFEHFWELLGGIDIRALYANDRGEIDKELGQYSEEKGLLHRDGYYAMLQQLLFDPTAEWIMTFLQKVLS